MCVCSCVHVLITPLISRFHFGAAAAPRGVAGVCGRLIKDEKLASRDASRLAADPARRSLSCFHRPAMEIDVKGWGSVQENLPRR